MLGEIERYNESGFQDSHTRIWIDSDRAPVDHSGTDLDTLFRFWKERSLIENDVPSVAAFHSPLAHLPWVDVSAINPLRYTMRNHPAGVCGNWDGAPFADHAAQTHARALAREYFNCKTLRAPAYIHTEQTMLGVDREYAKLLVPLADETGAITRVAYAWRFVRDPIALSRTN